MLGSTLDDVGNGVSVTNTNEAKFAVMLRSSSQLTEKGRAKMEKDAGGTHRHSKLLDSLYVSSLERPSLSPSIQRPTSNGRSEMTAMAHRTGDFIATDSISSRRRHTSVLVELRKKAAE